MIAAVERCRRRYLTAVGTNNFSRPLGGDAAEGSEAPVRRFTDVLELFDVVVESSRIGVRKPELAFYEACCRALQLEPAAVVFIDDLGVNLKPARAMGMTTIKFLTEEQAIADLEVVLEMPLR
jgi:putative hydrolase of the HAD superfamily